MISYPKILSATMVIFFAIVSTLHAAQVLFTPTLFLSESYTSNVELDSNNEVENYIFTAGMNLTGSILGRTAGLRLYYTPSYSAYDDVEDNQSGTNQEEYDSWRNEAGLFIWKEIKRNTRIDLSNIFLRTTNPVDESEAIDADDPTLGSVIESDPNRRGRREYSTNVAEARLTHQFGSNDSFYLAYQYRTIRDEDLPEVGEELLDNDTSTALAGLGINFSTKWSLQIDTSYASTDNEDETVNDRDEFDGNIRLLHSFSRTFAGFVAYRHTILNFDQDIDEEYQIYRPSIGIELTFKDNAGMTVGAGYYIQDFETSENNESFNMDSDIYKRWISRTGYFGIVGSSGYEIDDNGSQDNGFSIYYEGSVEAGYGFTPRLSSDVYGSFRYAEFPNQTPERVDRTYGAGAGINWQISRWLSVGLRYDHTQLSSDIASNEYTENRAMITMLMVPSSPFRLN